MTEKKASSSSSRPSSVPCKERQRLSAGRGQRWPDPAQTPPRQARARSPARGDSARHACPNTGQSRLPRTALRPSQRPRFAFEELPPQPGPDRATGTLSPQAPSPATSARPQHDGASDTRGVPASGSRARRLDGRRQEGTRKGDNSPLQPPRLGRIRPLPTPYCACQGLASSLTLGAAAARKASCLASPFLPTGRDQLNAALRSTVTPETGSRSESHLRTN